MIRLQTTKSILPKEATQILEWEPQEWIRNEIIMLNRFLMKNGIKKIVDDQKRVELRYELIHPMQSDYKGEDIYYSSPLARLDLFQVFTYDGKLYDCHGAPVNTRTLDFDTGAILVMTQDGTLFLSHKERGSIHHSTLLAAAPVAYACMLEVLNGRIMKEKVWSGHYVPTLEQQAQFHDRLQRGFYHDIPNHLVPIFLMDSRFRTEYPVCEISNKPIIEPARLPCGHVYNLTPFLGFYNKHRCCPSDHKRFALKEVVFDEGKYSKTKGNYPAFVSEVQTRIAELDAKVIQLGLDDRTERLASVSTISNKAQVILFLNVGTSARKIFEIAKALGICSGDPKFKANCIFDGINVCSEHTLGNHLGTVVTFILLE